MTTVFVNAFYEIAAEENSIQAARTDIYFECAAALLACPVQFVTTNQGRVAESTQSPLSTATHRSQRPLSKLVLNGAYQTVCTAPARRDKR